MPCAVFEFQFPNTATRLTHCEHWLCCHSRPAWWFRTHWTWQLLVAPLSYSWLTVHDIVLSWGHPPCTLWQRWRYNHCKQREREDNKLNMKGSHVGVVDNSFKPSNSATNVVCGLSFSRSQLDWEGFLQVFQFPPCSKSTPI